MMSLLFLILFQPPANEFFTEISEKTLDSTELSDFAYGFQAKEITYLSFMTHLVGFDHEGTILGSFNKRGAGPGELKSGGPIFMIGDKVFCYDVMGFKLVRFNSTLEIEKEGSLKEYSIAQLFFFNDGINLFSLSRKRNDGTGRILLEKWDTTELKATSICTIPDFKTKLEMIPLVPHFIDKSTIIFFEQLQVKETIEGYVFDLESQQLRTIELPHLDYDPRAKGKPKENYFSLLEFSSEIKGIGADDSNIYVFSINYDPGLSRTAEKAGFRYYAMDKKSFEILDVKDIPYFPISGFHNNPVQVMKNQDGGVVVAHPRHFLDR